MHSAIKLPLSFQPGAHTHTFHAPMCFSGPLLQGRASVPDAIKAELLAEIKKFILRA